jgi:hypothetical protein
MVIKVEDLDNLSKIEIEEKFYEMTIEEKEDFSNSLWKFFRKNKEKEEHILGLIKLLGDAVYKAKKKIKRG